MPIEEVNERRQKNAKSKQRNSFALDLIKLVKDHRNLSDEITSSSDELSFCLYESNWIGQTESCKKLLIIFCEVLKQPQELKILVYPMNLETFTTRSRHLLAKIVSGRSFVYEKIPVIIVDNFHDAIVEGQSKFADGGVAEYMNDRVVSQMVRSGGGEFSVRLDLAVHSG
ncbi:hypothetical protein Bhyg_04563 [Pseudolycoriella hygida]|uniref:Uncharacterized protein n=1 Tax=Pseudolycoriella hygida TaxID=35572 RepID=A0A9Q0S8G7_9DIPT|nr:hypothetical protein Bhyg_04563 [Pseudolycoriella hygida]